MSLVLWLLLYFLDSLFFYWVCFRDGAEQLEGTFASGFLMGIFATEWSAEGIRLYVSIGWAVATTWFVVGLFVPAARGW
jgi:hypothetical protein